MQQSSSKKLQRVQNTAAPLIKDIRKFNPISKALEELHGLSIKKRVTSKGLCTAHSSRSEQSPSAYLPILSPHISRMVLASQPSGKIIQPRTGNRAAVVRQSPVRRGVFDVRLRRGGFTVRGHEEICVVTKRANMHWATARSAGPTSWPSSAS
ncbi:hypothetical protein NDU88_002097 [Pleurodeles waltl]|uniref:Uncharacterized protein n=1 Tax=Pleurodeles waltl TaxID=8319 RepID=A0AAV7SEJ7_PLEWA|nr:hypothetical protein NDU88_002097 [Pleurodeles waltl]